MDTIIVSYQIYRKVGSDCDQKAPSLAKWCCLIRGLGGTGGTDWILTSGTKARDASSDNHHPEHSRSINYQPAILSPGPDQQPCELIAPTLVELCHVLP